MADSKRLIGQQLERRKRLKPEWLKHQPDTSAPDSPAGVDIWLRCHECWDLANDSSPFSPVRIRMAYRVESGPAFSTCDEEFETVEEGTATFDVDFCSEECEARARARQFRGIERPWVVGDIDVMVASWKVARFMLGPDEGDMERDDIEVEIQRCIKAAFDERWQPPGAKPA